MKLWYDSRLWYLVLACLFLFGLVNIIIGLDVYFGVITVGIVFVVAFKLIEKYIKRWRGSEEVT